MSIKKLYFSANLIKAVRGVVRDDCFAIPHHARELSLKAVRGEEHILYASRTIRTFIFLAASIVTAAQSQPFTIMVEPAGDAQHAGRTIDDSFERGITLQFAEELKKSLEKKRPGIRVILSRFPGESLEPLQNAHFANRLGVDLYVSIHFFQGKEGKQTLYVYHFLYNKITDYWQQHEGALSFIPFDQAHRSFLPLTKIYTQSIVKTLQSPLFNNQFEVSGPFGIPFKPLIGIAAPAIAFEGGIAEKNDWKIYVEPFAYSLKTVIDQRESHEINL